MAAKVKGGEKVVDVLIKSGADPDSAKDVSFSWKCEIWQSIEWFYNVVYCGEVTVDYLIDLRTMQTSLLPPPPPHPFLLAQITAVFFMNTTTDHWEHGGYDSIRANYISEKQTCGFHSQNGERALHLASRCGNLEVVNILLRENTEVARRSKVYLNLAYTLRG